MPSTTDTKISSSKLMGRPVGANAPLIMGNQKAIKINARKITVLKNIAESNQKRWSGDTMADNLPGGGGLGKTLNDIANNMDAIKNTILDQQEVDRGSAEDARVAAEKAGRGKQEKDLEEDKFEGLKQTAQKVLAPVKSVWDKILHFLTTIFLGKIAMKLFAWFADKENEKKVKAIGRFFKDFWPALLAGYLIFGNALGRFVGGLIGKVVIWTAKIIAKVIPALIKAVAKMKLGGMGGLLAVGAIAGGAMYMGHRMQQNRQADNEQDDSSTLTVDEFSQQEDKSKVNIQPSQAYGETGTFPGMMNFNQGGQIPGSGVGDTVPAMLTPGEFVMSAPAVNQWGASTLESMNAMGGGTNMPMMDGEGTTFAAGGGLIGGIKNMVGGLFGGGKEQSGSESQGYGAILDLIGKRESDSSGGYDAVNQMGTEGGHGVGDGYAGPFSEMSQHGGKKLTSLTVGEVMKLQSGWAGPMSNEEWIRNGKLHAVGRYQIIGPTLAGLVGRGVVSEGDPFNKATQNKLAIELIKGRGHDPSALQAEWIGLTKESIESIQKALSAGGTVKGTSGAGLGSGAKPANVSAPPPVTSVNPPVKPTTTVAYAQQKGQSPAGQNAQPLPSASLPEFDAAIMNSQAKIKVLGITV